MRKYGFVTWKDEGIWTAHSPSVPGVYGLGKTRRAAESDLASGLRDLFEYLAEIGEKAPVARHIAIGTVEV